MTPAKTTTEEPDEVEVDVSIRHIGATATRWQGDLRGEFAAFLEPPRISTTLSK